MSRSQRLLDLIQALRRRRRPVSAAVLAAELEVSARTLYRDIATLRSQGAPIEGEAGIGYVLRPGYLLPPLMFSAEEIEALALGTRWVAERGDAALGASARNAMARIAAVLPPALRDELEAANLLVGPGTPRVGEDATSATLRAAIRAEQVLRVTYADSSGSTTERRVWPFALAYFDHVRVLAAWCELRAAFRHFRTDRLLALAPAGERYPRRRTVLLREWRAQEDIPEQ